VSGHTDSLPLAESRRSCRLEPRYDRLHGWFCFRSHRAYPVTACMEVAQNPRPYSRQPARPHNHPPFTRRPGWRKHRSTLSDEVVCQCWMPAACRSPVRCRIVSRCCAIVRS
jgi:hypothetical protein